MLEDFTEDSNGDEDQKFLSEEPSQSDAEYEFDYEADDTDSYQKKASKTKPRKYNKRREREAHDFTSDEECKHKSKKSRTGKANVSEKLCLRAKSVNWNTKNKKRKPVLKTQVNETTSESESDDELVEVLKVIASPPMKNSAAKKPTKAVRVGKAPSVNKALAAVRDTLQKDIRASGSTVRQQLTKNTNAVTTRVETAETLLQNAGKVLLSRLHDQEGQLDAMSRNIDRITEMTNSVESQGASLTTIKADLVGVKKAIVDSNIERKAADAFFKQQLVRMSGSLASIQASRNQAVHESPTIAVPLFPAFGNENNVGRNNENIRRHSGGNFNRYQMNNPYANNQYSAK